MTKQFRGISPVVATALLVLIAVATAALLYLWVSGTVQNLPQNAYQLQEQIKIDAVQYNITNNKYNFTIYVRNVGNTPVKLDTVYIINGNGTVVGYNTLNVTIRPGEVENITNITVDKSKLEGATVVQIKIVTASGVEASYVLPLRS